MTYYELRSNKTNRPILVIAVTPPKGESPRRADTIFIVTTRPGVSNCPHDNIMSPYISKMPFQPFLASFTAIPLIKMVNITYKMTKNDHNLTPIFLMILYCIFFCHPKQHYSVKVYNILACPCNIDYNIVKPFS